MSKKKHTIEIITGAVIAASKSESLQKMVLGTYSDGRVRSIGDALEGEVLSPKQREEFLYKKSKKKHKKKHKKNKSKKYKKIKLD